MSTTSETYQVVLSSTPPEDLPHATRAEEIQELTEYLAVQHARDAGTDYIVTSADYAGSDRFYIAKDVNGYVEGIYSKVGNDWKRWDFTEADGCFYIDSDTGELKLYTDDTLVLGTEDTTAGSATLGKRPLTVPLGDGLRLQNNKVEVIVDDSTIKLEDVEIAGVTHRRLYSPLATPVYYVQASYAASNTISIPAPTAYTAHNIQIAKLNGNMDLDATNTLVLVEQPGFYFVSLALGVAAMPGNLELFMQLQYRTNPDAAYVTEDDMCRYSNYMDGTAGAVVVGAGGETLTALYESIFQHVTLASPTRILDFTAVSADSPGHIKLRLVANSIRTAGKDVTLHAYNSVGNYPFLMSQCVLTVGYLGAAES